MSCRILHVNSMINDVLLKLDYVDYNFWSSHPLCYKVSLGGLQGVNAVVLCNHETQLHSPGRAVIDSFSIVTELGRLPNQEIHPDAAVCDWERRYGDEYRLITGD